MGAGSRRAGSGPTEQLKDAIDWVLHEIFDFDETARRAMAQHSRSLTKEFVELFDPLERTYFRSGYIGRPAFWTLRAATGASFPTVLLGLGMPWLLTASP